MKCTLEAGGDLSSKRAEAAASWIVAVKEAAELAVSTGATTVHYCSPPVMFYPAQTGSRGLQLRQQQRFSHMARNPGSRADSPV